MLTMYEVIPGILEKTWEEVEKKIQLLSPFAKSLHIDIIDGKFAPNLTFLDPKPFTKYKDQFFLEAHLMVDEPINYLKPFADAGFKRFLGHVEKMSSQEEFVAQGQLLGEVGLAVDGPTPLDAIRVPYNDLDCIVFMTITAGFSGQSFMSEKLEKVKILKSKTSIPIEVDGGVKDTTIALAKNAGATRFVATSFISGATSPQNAYHLLQETIKQFNG